MVIVELGSTETTEEEKDVNVWEDNWDDDVVEDDFSNQLR
jgi:DSS1/SEM1 family